MPLYLILLVSFIALQHLLFFYMESIAWTRLGPKVFKGFKAEHFATTKSMAFNQGVYNVFLAAGLIWGLLVRDQPELSLPVLYFFLSCVVVAAVAGAVSVSKRIWMIQGMPALIALFLLQLHV